MRHTVTTVLGKGIKSIAQLRGGGSALPGLFVETIDPTFTKRILDQLPRGVVIISGTNGKTTTTKMVVELLESQGLRVFTNRTGSNFTRGVAAALLGDISPSGKLDADIAVLELDEAHAVHFVRAIQPTYCLLLNVMRDQLDRFGEIDKTAELLHTIASRTTSGIVINRDDPRLSNPTFTSSLLAPVHTYGVSAQLLATFPSDDTLHDEDEPSEQSVVKQDDTELARFDAETATITFVDHSYPVTLALRGIYNIQNAVGAVAITRMIMGEQLDTPAMLAALSAVQPAFGRGESIRVGDTTVELILVKNPSGFRLGLKSFDSKEADIMIAINDDYADGRDMSWLWDVDFTALDHGVAVVSGTRAYDMALRLDYDNVRYDSIEPDLSVALARLLDGTAHQTKRIFCTYTAMLTLRRHLSKYTKVEAVR